MRSRISFDLAWLGGNRLSNRLNPMGRKEGKIDLLKNGQEPEVGVVIWGSHLPRIYINHFCSLDSRS